MENEVLEQPTAPQEPSEWNPPAGDLSFDDLFPTDDIGAGVNNAQRPQPVETQPTEPESTPQAEPPQAQTPVASRFNLKTSTGTVYETEDAAIRGIEEKDRAIADLRSKVIALSGIDPLNRKAVQPESQTRNESYLQNPTRYAEDLTEAAKGQKYDKYLQSQARLIDEVVSQRYGHLLPTIEKIGRQEAVEDLASEVPAFREFYGSDAYKETLDRHPTLRDAIKTAESNPAMQKEYLPDLYRLTWESSVARKTSERPSGGSSTPTTPTNSTPARMPMTPQSRPSLQVPDAGRQQSQVQPGMTSSAGRKALIADLEAKGIKDFSF